MFNNDQKKLIAQKIEELLLSFKHPEMPEEKPEFFLHVKGDGAWSWDDIEPNHHFENKNHDRGINLFNELVGKAVNKKCERCINKISSSESLLLLSLDGHDFDNDKKFRRKYYESDQVYLPPFCPQCGHKREEETNQENYCLTWL